MPEKYNQEELYYVYNLPDKSLREELLKVIRERDEFKQKAKDLREQIDIDYWPLA